MSKEVCGYVLAGEGICEEKKPCSKHSQLMCRGCGAKATRDCSKKLEFVCRVPLCNYCEHKIVNGSSIHVPKIVTGSNMDEIDFLRIYPLAPEEVFYMKPEKTLDNTIGHYERGHAISREDELECLIKNRFYKFPHINISFSLSSNKTAHIFYQSNVVLKRQNKFYLVLSNYRVLIDLKDINTAYKIFVDQCLNISKNYIINESTIKYHEVYKEDNYK